MGRHRGFAQSSCDLFDLPEPASRQAVLDAYDRALNANPKVRLLLLTHLSHRTGLVVPVAEVARMAKADNDAIVATLRDTHKILTVRRAGVAKGQCIRVTPSLYTRDEDLDRFVAALTAITGEKAG